LLHLEEGKNVVASYRRRDGRWKKGQTSSTRYQPIYTGLSKCFQHMNSGGYIHTIACRYSTVKSLSCADLLVRSTQASDM
jgi:hypothetical protein